MRNTYTANQDIRDYLEDHGVTQKAIAEKLGVSQWTICQRLKTEFSQSMKEEWLNHIDAIASQANKEFAEEVLKDEQDTDSEAIEETSDVSVSTKFQIGDRVKIPSKANKICTVTDIWHSLAKASVMYAVEDDSGVCGLYAEAHLEPAPIPIEYSWEAHIDGNVAVATMIATQGDKTWIYARGHAHIIHDGEVGMAQAISFAARRMFESLDSKQENKIYVRGAV